MDKEQALISWQDIGGTFGAWGFLFGILESLGVPLGYALLTIVVPALVVLVLVQVRLSKRKLYTFLPGTHAQAVDAQLIQYVQNTKTYALLSHFRHEAASEPYLKALAEARSRGVNVRRLVGCPEEELEQHEGTAWIRSQIEQQLAEHRFLRAGEPTFAWEMYVFDGAVAALALPAADPLSEGGLPNTLISRDLRFIKSLETLYAYYWKKAEGPKGDERSGPDGT